MDLKLGARMLVKYPGLTVAGSLAMAFAICAGVITFEAVQCVVAPVLPLPEGDRIVGFKFVDRAQGTEKLPSSYDFMNFRQELGTVREIGAYRLQQRNLSVAGGDGEPVTTTQISASAFRLTRVPPLFGRTLADADEAPGAPAVIVLGHALWQSRFAGDRAVLGREVRLGDARPVVVGVMPEGFRFPVDDHLWLPLPTAELAREPGRDALHVFGRLAADASLAGAEAEATALVARTAAMWPDFYTHLTPQVLPYAASIVAIPAEGKAGLYAVNLLAALFLAVICGNVALLMFARAATREKELLVRTALGATRGRIIGMLFLEALVLSATAAILGLVAAEGLLRWTTGFLRAGPDRWPFWIEGGLSFTAVLYAGLLAVLAALIAGVVPAVKVMGRGLWDRLRQSGAGGGGLRMGGLWTGAIVAQIAGMVLFTAVAFVIQRQAAYIASYDGGFPASQFLSARLELDPTGAEETAGDGRQRFLDRYLTTARELERRLIREPGIAKVILAEHLPRMPGPGRSIEVEGTDETTASVRSSVRTAAVDPGFFEVFQMPLEAGRGFDSRDAGKNANTVIVNRTFVDQVLQGQNPIGRRVRYQAEPASDPSRAPTGPGPWLEIVGVVRDAMPRTPAPLNLDNPMLPRFYRPLGADAGSPALRLAIQGRAGIEPLVPILRRIAGEVNPALRLYEVTGLDQATSEDERFWGVFAQVVLAGSAFTILLSLAGVYAVMSFTVSRRTREIGVRTALGGQSWRVSAEIFRRPFRQVVAGVVLGLLLFAALMVLETKGSLTSLMKHAPLMLAYGLLLILVCGLACLGPIRRALRIQPTEALRDDG